MPCCPLVDCHTHTHFSDGVSTFEENVRAAAGAGCELMVSTDHLTLPASMDAPGDVQVTVADLPAHRAAFDDAVKLAAELSPSLKLLYGFECDWYPGCESLVKAWSAGAAVRLGSIHWLGDPGNIMAALLALPEPTMCPVPTRPTPTPAGLTTMQTCMFGKTSACTRSGAAMSTPGAPPAKAARF